MVSTEEVACKRIKQNSECIKESTKSCIPDTIDSKKIEDDVVNLAGTNDCLSKLSARPLCRKQKIRSNTPKVRAPKHKGVQSRGVEYYQASCAAPRIITRECLYDASDSVSVAEVTTAKVKYRRGHQKPKLVIPHLSKSLAPLQPQRTRGILPDNDTARTKLAEEGIIMPLLSTVSSPARTCRSDRDTSVPQMPSIVAGVSKPLQNDRYDTKLASRSLLNKPKEAECNSKVPVMPAIPKQKVSSLGTKAENSLKQGRSGAVPIILPKLEQQMEDSLIGLSYLTKDAGQKREKELLRGTASWDLSRCSSRPQAPSVGHRPNQRPGDLGKPDEPKLRGTSALVHSRSERSKKERRQKRANSHSSACDQ